MTHTIIYNNYKGKKLYLMEFYLDVICFHFAQSVDAKSLTVTVAKTTIKHVALRISPGNGLALFKHL